MTGPSSNRESNPQILLVSARSSILSPFTISRGYLGPIRHQGDPSGAPTPDPHGVNVQKQQSKLKVKLNAHTDCTPNTKIRSLKTKILEKNREIHRIETELDALKQDIPHFIIITMQAGITPIF